MAFDRYKFRGKRVDNGEWVYGYYVKGFGYNVNDIENRIFTLDGMYIHEVEEETVGQYAGLKDKNGREIYEGDIIEKTYYSYHQPECSELFEIKYEGLGFHFKHIKGNAFYLPFTEDIEVIGNIYENPELLEKIE